MEFAPGNDADGGSLATAIKPGKGLTRNLAIKRQGTISERSGGARPHFTLTQPPFTPRYRSLNKAGESGKSIESYESIPKGNIRGAVACSFAKTRVRQDAGHSLRDAGAPRGETSLPLTFGQSTFTPRYRSQTKRVSQVETS